MSKYQDELEALKQERDRVMRETWESYQTRIREMKEKHRSDR